MLKSDVGERLVNIRVQSWGFYVESNDSLFLPLIIHLIYLLSIDVTQGPFPSILGRLRSSGEQREEEAGLRRRRSGWVSVSLNGSHWIWREKLTAWLLILLLWQRLAVGQLESESLRLIQTFNLLAKAFKQFSVRYAPDKARAPACLHALRVSNSFWVEITLEKLLVKWHPNLGPLFLLY